MKPLEFFVKAPSNASRAHWQLAISNAAQREVERTNWPMTDKAVEVKVNFLLPMAKATKRDAKHDKKPGLPGLLLSLGGGLEHIVIDREERIRKIDSEKFYAAPYSCGALITVAIA